MAKAYFYNFSRNKTSKLTLERLDCGHQDCASFKKLMNSSVLNFMFCNKGVCVCVCVCE